MCSRLLRLRGLVQRYRVDRRLPPQVVGLFKEVGRLRLDATVSRSLADWRRPIRTSSTAGGGGVLARQGSRRVEVFVPLDRSFEELAHDYAGRIVSTFEAHSVDTFVVGRDRDAIVLGIELEQRSDALDALVQALREPGWLLDWEDGSRSGTVALRKSRRRRVVLRARRWRIYQAAAWGDRAVGQDQAAQVTFWHLGTSGQLELVGTRGHERFDPRSPATVEVVDGREYPGRTAFPVGSDLARMESPIDIVYTWVDGSDPAWQDTFRSTAHQFGRTVDEVALDPARYRSRDELRYSLRSVWAFCGWARQIYIVTAGQVPSWLAEDPRVRIVDHSEILPSNSLPTFNSHAMESALHHIDGLAEHFIYFNDDMLVGRSLRPEDFFTPNGLARVFSSGARVPGVEDDQTLAVDTAARRGRELLNQRFGRVVVDKPLHSPYPLRRSVMEEIEKEFPDAVCRTSHSRFRSPTDLSIAASFAQHYAVAVGKAVLGTISTEYVHVESGRLGWHLDRILLGRDVDTFCINETEQRDSNPEACEQRIREFFERCLPVSAPWESDQPGLPSGIS